jgi:hypothetical protein
MSYRPLVGPPEPDVGHRYHSIIIIPERRLARHRGACPAPIDTIAGYDQG